MGAHWYAIYTHAQAERTATSHLVRQGFEIYRPCYLKTRSHARRVERVAAPLFPRYLFVAMDVERSRWLAVRSTVGVHSLVSQGSVPTPLSTSVIDQIRAREGEDGFVVLEDPAFWRPGTRLYVTDGPLAECMGLFQGMSDRDRVTLLLDILGRPVRVTVPVGVVRGDH